MRHARRCVEGAAGARPALRVAGVPRRRGGPADVLAAAWRSRKSRRPRRRGARSGLPDAVVRRAEELLVAETPAAPADANADALWSALDAARAEAADAAQAAADEREQLSEERAALRAAVGEATERASRRARMAATRLEKREAKLEGMFRELNKWENDAKRVVGATLDAARLENKEGRTDAVAAVLASHGLAAIPPGKDVKVGDDLLHVAGVDVEAGTVRVLAGVVASIDLDVVSSELPDGTVLEKIPRSRPREVGPSPTSRTARRSSRRGRRRARRVPGGMHARIGDIVAVRCILISFLRFFPEGRSTRRGCRRRRANSMTGSVVVALLPRAALEREHELSPEHVLQRQTTYFL